MKGNADFSDWFSFFNEYAKSTAETRAIPGMKGIFYLRKTIHL